VGIKLNNQIYFQERRLHGVAGNALIISNPSPSCALNLGFQIVYHATLSLAWWSFANLAYYLPASFWFWHVYFAPFGFFS
jgi:hypothetical protein